MISSLFHTAIADPLYNALVFLVSIVPFADLGLAVIVLTVVVKLILFPLSLKAAKTQILVRAVEPKINSIKEKYKDDKAEQARQTMALYKESDINPFSSFLLLLIQLPIIFGLYWVFAFGGLPQLNYDILYAFTPRPEIFNVHFLWVSDIAKSSAVLALLAGVTQYFQIKLTLPTLKARDSKEKPSLKDDLTRSFHMQMRYLMPVIVVVIAYIISAAIAIYWTTSNLFAIGQELYVRRKLRTHTKEGTSFGKTEVVSAL
ncbi:MAG TPA: YidC/Oxa1 family membrane protein insertase [Candidatus Paceibacterota bacterium]